MVARDELNRRRQPFQTTYSSLNNLRDFRWPPKFLRSRERHANRGLKSWVQKQAQNALQPAVQLDIGVSYRCHLLPHLWYISTTMLDLRSKARQQLLAYYFTNPRTRHHFRD